MSDRSFGLLQHCRQLGDGGCSLQEQIYDSETSVLEKGPELLGALESQRLFQLIVRY